MNDKQKQKSQKSIRHTNVLESLGGTTSQSLKEDLIKKVPGDFMEQLFGPGIQRTFSGEITAGETLEIGDVFSGQHEKNQKLEKQLALERKLRQEEEIRTQRKGNELRMQLKALMEEVVVLAQATEELGEETKIAVMQAPVEPGIYHIIFFEKLLEFIKSFRKKISQASTWLHATNKRAAKKNYWTRYKKHGGKFLLSAEHYLSRSAG